MWRNNFLNFSSSLILCFGCCDHTVLRKTPNKILKNFVYIGCFTDRYFLEKGSSFLSMITLVFFFYFFSDREQTLNASYNIYGSLLLGLLSIRPYTIWRIYGHRFRFWHIFPTFWDKTHCFQDYFIWINPKFHEYIFIVIIFFNITPTGSGPT